MWEIHKVLTLNCNFPSLYKRTGIWNPCVLMLVNAPTWQETQHHLDILFCFYKAKADGGGVLPFACQWSQRQKLVCVQQATQLICSDISICFITLQYKRNEKTFPSVKSRHVEVGEFVINFPKVKRTLTPPPVYALLRKWFPVCR